MASVMVQPAGVWGTAYDAMDEAIGLIFRDHFDFVIAGPNNRPSNLEVAKFLSLTYEFAE